MAEFRLLGPVEVWSEGRRVDAGQPRQRSVLAVLLAEAGRSVPVETVIDRVWGAAPPRAARSALHGHITRIRQVLRRAAAADEPAADVVFAANCYLLDVEDVAVDLHRFRRLAARARSGDCPDDRRVELLREAMGLWRGEPLSGLSGEWVERARTAWWQQYLDTAVAWAAAELDAENPGATVDVLQDLAERFPLTESVPAVLMRALAAAGRPADALARYELTRRRLREDLGTDPGAELQAVHREILRGERPQAPPRAVRALPADVAGFVGRGDEMGLLLAAVDAAASGRTRSVAIHAVDGMAGVGKTAFAVHAAHCLAERFPDGQQFIDLRAHAPGRDRVEASAALETLLQADGVAPKQIPAGVDARAALWRERMAGKRLLLVLDDAADPAHVAPLLPAAPGCLVLVTSRRKLATLPGALVLSLDTLPHADAVALFVQRAGPRASRAPDAVVRMIRLCGHLPLAIVLTAARLQTHPTWTVTDLADDLEQARQRLTELASGDLAVAAAFELSYRDLPADLQRLFRRLALHPGTDLDAHAAAALSDSTRAVVRRGLEHLLEHNLITEPHRGRYRFHDLIAEHARTHAGQDPANERDAALDRLLNYYLHTAGVAASRQLRETSPARWTPAVVTGPAAPDAPVLQSAAEAGDWLTVEQPNLVAATDYAARHDHPAAVGIPAALYHHLRSCGPLELAVRLHHIAVTAAARREDRPAQAHALVDLANTYHLIGQYPAATTTAGQAHALYRQLGDASGQADTLDTLAHVRYAVGDYRAATDAAEQARVLYQQLDDRRGQAHTLRILAWVRLASGDYPAAAGNLDRTRALFRQLGDRLGEANTLDVLARVQIVIGDYPAATVSAEQARALYRKLASRPGETNTLEILACIQSLTGQYAAAKTNAEDALTLADQLGNRHGRAVVLRTLAHTQRLTGDHRAAAANAGQALALYREFGDRLGQANALQVLGVVQRETWDQRRSAATLQEALGLFREVGDPDGEAETLNHLGQLLLDTAAPVDANRHFTDALHIARRIGTPLHEARALEGSGHSLLRRGQREDGIPLLKEALAIYQRLGTPDAETLRVALDHEERRPTGAS